MRMFDKKKNKNSGNVAYANVVQSLRYEYQEEDDNTYNQMNPFSIENVRETTSDEYPQAKHDLDDIYNEIKDWKDEEQRSKEKQVNVEVHNNQNMSCCTIL